MYIMPQKCSSGYLQKKPVLDCAGHTDMYFKAETGVSDKSQLVGMILLALDLWLRYIGKRQTARDAVCL